ncbi:MAG: hypothetical protein LBR79_02130 [Oscillospiraceae bacterium]|nr:hypothetical protein [Oscillospiraceae bacterium]
MRQRDHMSKFTFFKCSSYINVSFLRRRLRKERLWVKIVEIHSFSPPIRGGERYYQLI